MKSANKIRVGCVGYCFMYLDVTVDGVESSLGFSDLWSVDEFIKSLISTKDVKKAEAASMDFPRMLEAPMITEISLTDARDIVRGMVREARAA